MLNRDRFAGRMVSASPAFPRLVPLNEAAGRCYDFASFAPPAQKKSDPVQAGLLTRGSNADPHLPGCLSSLRSGGLASGFTRNSLPLTVAGAVTELGGEKRLARDDRPTRTVFPYGWLDERSRHHLNSANKEDWRRGVNQLAEGLLTNTAGRGKPMTHRQHGRGASVS